MTNLNFILILVVSWYLIESSDQLESAENKSDYAMLFLVIRQIQFYIT